MAKEEVAAEAAAPKKKSGKLMIILGAVVLVVVVAVVVVVLLMSGPKKGDGEEGDEVAEEVVDDKTPPIYERLEAFTLNLADQQTYLQIEIQLMVADAGVQQKLKLRMPEVRDAMIRLLSSKMPEELSQQEGKNALADEIASQLNGLLGVKQASAGVKKVLFGSFIIQ